jgi:hypothetical protein
MHWVAEELRLPHLERPGFTIMAAAHGTGDRSARASQIKHVAQYGNPGTKSEPVSAPEGGDLQITGCA